MTGLLRTGVGAGAGAAAAPSVGPLSNGFEAAGAGAGAAPRPLSLATPLTTSESLLSQAPMSTSGSARSVTDTAPPVPSPTLPPPPLEASAPDVSVEAAARPGSGGKADSAWVRNFAAINSTCKKDRNRYWITQITYYSKNAIYFLVGSKRV